MILRGRGFRRNGFCVILGTLKERGVWMKKIKLALLGLGTVGTGVYKLIDMRSDVMEQTIGAQLEIKKILVHNMHKKREGVDPSLLTDDWKEIIEDDEIQIVVEVIGGMEPARTMILEALRAGKHVVSANKDLIAEQGRELLDTAQETGADFLFEAAVAGGIPIIRPLKQCLAANEISEVLGIVNGTTNYILTKMFEDGMEFDDALKKAQELGYAEADPTADVEGLDAGRKVAIMASIAFHSRVVFDDVYTEGISKITAADIAYAKEFDSVIKLLGVARNTPDGIEAGVYPVMLNREHPLASVRNSFNAVFIHGDAVDDAMFYGRGAGEMPTASAVVADVVDAAKHLHRSIMTFWSTKKLELTDISNAKRRFFVRAKGDGQADAIRMAELFGPVELVNADLEGEFGFITGKLTEAEYQERAAKTDAIIHMIRVEG